MSQAPPTAVSCSSCQAEIEVTGRTIVTNTNHGRRIWVEVHCCGDHGPSGIDLGRVPRPRGGWQTFWHHVHHGLMMRYRLTEVLRFSWANRRSFDPSPWG
jgi:hypothetical protein